MANTGEKLEKRFQDTTGLIEYANELIGVLESGKSVANEIKKLADTRSKVVDKFVKAKQATSTTRHSELKIIFGELHM